jgi:hypothetical protein
MTARRERDAGGRRSRGSPVRTLSGLSRVSKAIGNVGSRGGNVVEEIRVGVRYGLTRLQRRCSRRCRISSDLRVSAVAAAEAGVVVLGWQARRWSPEEQEHNTTKRQVRPY